MYMYIRSNVYSKYFVGYKSRLRQAYPFLTPNSISKPSYQNELKPSYGDESSDQPNTPRAPYGQSNFISEPSYQNELKPTYEDETQATLRPPKPLYSIRIRQRSVFPCNKYKELCARLRAEKKVVDCGGIRFR